MSAAADWREPMVATCREAGIRHVAYVPDAGHDHFIARAIADPAFEATALTNEAEGIGLLAGAWLGGDKGVLLMQSSGVGNCINALALAASCGFPLPMIVTMRGEHGEFNPWQVPMSRATEPSLAAVGTQVERVTRREDAAPQLAALLAWSIREQRAAALLLGQNLFDAKDWTK